MPEKVEKGNLQRKDGMELHADTDHAEGARNIPAADDRLLTTE